MGKWRGDDEGEDFGGNQERIGRPAFGKMRHGDDHGDDGRRRRQDRRSARGRKEAELEN